MMNNGRLGIPPTPVSGVPSRPIIVQPPSSSQQQQHSAGFTKHWTHIGVPASPPPLPPAQIIHQQQLPFQQPRRLHSSPPPSNSTTTTTKQFLIPPSQQQKPSQSQFQRQPSTIVIPQRQEIPSCAVLAVNNSLQQQQQKLSNSPPTTLKREPSAPIIICQQQQQQQQQTSPPVQPQQIQQQQQNESVEKKVTDNTEAIRKLTEEVEALKRQVQEKDGAVTNLRQRLTTTEEQDEAQKTDLRNRLSQLQTQLKEETGKNATQTSTEVRNLQSHLQFKDKEIMDIRAERDVLIQKLQYQQQQNAKRTSISTTTSNKEEPSPKRSKSSERISQQQQELSSSFPNQSSLRSRLSRKLLQVGVPASNSIEMANESHKRGQRVKFYDIIMEVIDRTIPCGALIPILESVLSQQDEQLLHHALITTEVLMSSCNQCKSTIIGTNVSDSASIPNLLPSAIVGVGSNNNTNLSFGIDLSRVKFSTGTTILQTPQSDLVQKASTTTSTTTTTTNNTTTTTIRSIREDMHPQRSALLSKMIENCKILFSTEQLALPTLRIIDSAFDNIHLTSSTSPSFSLSISKFEPLLTNGALKNIMDLSNGRKPSLSICESIINILSHFLSSYKFGPVTTTQQQSNNTTIIDNVAMILNKWQQQTSSSSDDTINDEQEQENLRRIRWKIIKFLLTMISSRGGINGSSGIQEITSLPQPSKQQQPPPQTQQKQQKVQLPPIDVAKEFDFNFGQLFTNATALLDSELNIALSQKPIDNIGLIRDTADLLCFVSDEEVFLSVFPNSEPAQFIGVFCKLMRLTSLLKNDSALKICASKLSFFNPSAASQSQSQPPSILYQQQQQQQNIKPFNP